MVAAASPLSTLIGAGKPERSEGGVRLGCEHSLPQTLTPSASSPLFADG